MNSMRLTKVDEFQMLTCLKHGVWGSSSDRFKKWALGDRLVIIVDGSIAAVGRVSGPRYRSKDIVWDNGEFPFRIPIEFELAFRAPTRPAVLGPLRDALAAAFPSGGYGLAMVNQHPLPDAAAQAVTQAVESLPNQLAEVMAKLDSLLVAADLEREHRRARKRVRLPKTTAVDPVEVGAEGKHGDEKDDSDHTRIQHALIALGRLTGCDVWIAPNDRRKIYLGEQLGAQCLSVFPSIGLPDAARKRASLIDIIWIRNDAPAYLFEVETSTTVYSGLLRMADLLAVAPALKMRLFVVAPTARRTRVIAELGRPVFKQMNLPALCSYIPAEALDKLHQQFGDLKAGHLLPSIIETIGVDISDEPVSMLG